MGTIDYYNRNAHSYAEDTQAADMSAMHELFESYVSAGKILDLGCGAGRDSRYFLERGYDVTAVDGSAELCRIASEYTGLKVRCMLFEELDYENEFDGVWACSSLLHCSKEELETVFRKIALALKDGGTFYCSFKYGSFSGERNGRFFTDLTEEDLSQLVSGTAGLQLIRTVITADVRPGRENEKWLNGIIQKQ